MKKSMKFIAILLIVLLGGLAVFFTVQGIQSFNLTKTALKIKINDATKTYDGTPLTPSGYEISEGKLNDGDTIKISYDDSLTDVGSTSAGGNVTIVDKNGNDVTSNYDVDVEDGYLNVTKSNLDISIKNSTLTYGEEFDDQSFALSPSSSLGSGDSITTTYTNTEDGNQKVTFSVTNKDGEDVTSNYTIKVTGGSQQTSSTDSAIISLEKRDIYIKPVTLTKVYDGTPLNRTANSFEYYNNSDTLVTGDKIYFSYDDGTLDVTSSSCFNGTYSIRKDSIQILNKNNEDVTKYYNINLDSAIIGIYKQEISLKFKTFTYDEISINGINDIFSNINDYSSLNLTFIPDEYNSLKNYILSKDAGSYKYEYDYENPLFLNIDSNYLVTFDNITIAKKSISVSIVDNLSKAYEGNISITDSDLIFKDSSNNIYSLSDKNLEAYNLSYNLSGDSTTKTVYLYGLSLRKKITNNGITSYRDVTSNYDIDYCNGSIEITKASLEIKPSDETKVYDGKELTFKSYEVVNGKLYNGDYLIIDYSEYSITNVNESGNFSFDVSKIKVMSLTGEDVTKYYDIASSEGSLTITKANLTISPKDNSKTYDGTSLSFDESKIVVLGLSNNESVSYSNLPNITNVNESGEYSIDSNSITITNSKGEDVTDNYNIFINNAKLEINKASLELEFNDVNYSEGFKSSSINDVFKNAPSSLFISSSEFANFNTYVKTLSVGEHQIDLTTYPFINDEGSNYEYVLSSLNVLRTNTTLTVTVSDKTSLNYDGTYPTNYNYSNFNLIDKGVVKVEGLDSNDHISDIEFNCTSSSSETKNGVFKYKIESITILDSNGNDVTSYYDISYSKTDFTLSKFNSISLDVSISSTTVTYDEDIDYTDSNFLKSLVNINYSSLVTGNYIDSYWYNNISYDSDSHEVTLTSININDKDGNDVSIFYDLSSIYQSVGYLFINPKTIYVTLNDIYLTYDDSINIFETDLYSISNKNDLDGNIGKITYYNGNEETSLTYINQHTGTYTFTYTLDNPNYNVVTTGNGIISIAKKEIEVTLNSQYLTYGDEIDTATLVTKNYTSGPTGTITYYKNGTEVYKSQIESNAGTYTFTYTIEDSNYTLKTNGTGIIVVSKKQIEVTLNDQYLTYGDEIDTTTLVTKNYTSGPTGTITYYKNGTEVSKSQVEYSVGTYTFTYKLDDSDSKNYELIIHGTGKIEIAKKKVNVTLLDASIEVSESINISDYIKFAYKGDFDKTQGNIEIYFGSDLVSTISCNSSITLNNAGTYTFVYSLDDSNYEIVLSGEGKIEVSKIKVYATLNSQYLTYGDSIATSNLVTRNASDPEGEITYYKNGESVDITEIKNVGTYSFTYKLTSQDSKNYELILDGNGIIVINKKVISIMLNNVTKSQGDTLYNIDLASVLTSGFDISDFTFVCYKDGQKIDINEVTTEVGTYTYTYMLNDTNNYEVNYLTSAGTIVVA